jgi:hypothetical protein
MLTSTVFRSLLNPPLLERMIVRPFWLAPYHEITLVKYSTRPLTPFSHIRQPLPPWETFSPLLGNIQSTSGILVGLGAAVAGLVAMVAFRPQFYEVSAKKHLRCLNKQILRNDI